jgi:hypothetical protein
VHPIETERQTFLDRHRGLCAVTGVAVPQAHAEWEAFTAHAEAQEDLLEIIAPIFAVPIGRPGWDKPRNRADLFLIGPIQADRRRILMEPGGRDSIDLQGIECDGAKDTSELRGKQRIENLTEAVIVQRGSFQAILEQGEHPTFLQTCPHFIEGMMAIENREKQSLDPTATREDIGRVWSAEGIDERSYLELAEHTQHQRQVGHGPDLMNYHRHEVSLLLVFLEQSS